MQMVEQDPNKFVDPEASNDDYWDRDPTRETTLCELWEETTWLYDSSQKAHMTESRADCMKRFATILKVPRE